MSSSKSKDNITGRKRSVVFASPEDFVENSFAQTEPSTNVESEEAQKIQIVVTEASHGLEPPELPGDSLQVSPNLSLKTASKSNLFTKLKSSATNLIKSVLTDEVAPDEEEDEKETAEKEVKNGHPKANQILRSAPEQSLKSAQSSNSGFDDDDDNGNKLKKGSSKAASRMASFSSAGSSNNGRGGKEITVTPASKFAFMQSLVVAFALNIIYMWLMTQLISTNGLVVSISGSIMKHAGPLAIEVISMVCFAFTSSALDSGAAALVGYLLTRKKGYSIAACGFCHADMFSKLFFAGTLSFRSTAKKFLNRMSLIWLIHVALLVLTVFSSTGVSSNNTNIVGTSLMCVQYSQTLPLASRGVPTIESMMGAAELIDGTALGVLASEMGIAARSPTRHFFPSQLTDVCADGSTIIGPGFMSKLYSTCVCSLDSSNTGLISAGVPAASITAFQSQISTLGLNSGWVNGISNNGTAMFITTVLVGFKLCGGSNAANPSLSVCKTSVYEHKHGSFQVTYKTDGSPASIAPKIVTLISEGLPADITWLANSTMNLLGGAVSGTFLPPHWPGSINPLLWTMSSNSQEIGLALIEPGLEGALAIVLRGSMQRSYSANGGQCVQNLIDPTTSTLRISQLGYSFGLAWSVLQLIINLIALLMFVPWLSSQDPILPAVEMASDFILFSLMCSKNEATYKRLAKLSTNLEPALMWPKLDVILRVGESVESRDDPDRGILTLDRPDKVCELQRAKLYE